MLIEAAEKEKRAKTQKARGLFRLSERPIPPFYVFSADTLFLVQEEADIPDKGYPFFARPCPFRPRHGFIESRLCSSKEEVCALLREVKEADPEGEVILMAPVYAGANWVITPSTMTLGPGNDGATAGKGAIVFPFSLREIPVWEDLVGEGEVPYIEAIHGGGWGDVIAVQYRSGPPGVASPDYIPREVEVKRVFTIKENIPLLEWETLVKTLPEGTVVYHPGGALSSHYGVHCVANGVPYVMSREPQVGEVLRPVSQGWDEEDLLYLAEQIRKAELRPSPMTGLASALGILHGVGFALSVKPQKAFLEVLAGAMVALARYTAGASVAELRYATDHLKGGVPPQVREALKEVVSLDVVEIDRDEAYEGALTWDLATVMVALRHAARTFALPDWESAYGGWKWASATQVARLYVTRLLRFAKRPTRRGLASLVEAANHLLNTNHNNGWYLNKWPWRGWRDLDLLAQNPARVILIQGYKPIFAFAGREEEVAGFNPHRIETEEGYLEKVIARYGKDLRHALLQEPPPFSQKVEALITPYRNHLQVQVRIPIPKGRPSWEGIIVAEILYEAMNLVVRLVALALTFEWGLAWKRGEASLQPFNGDRLYCYASIPALWDGGNRFALKTQWGWAVLEKKEWGWGVVDRREAW